MALLVLDSISREANCEFALITIMQIDSLAPDEEVCHGMAWRASCILQTLARTLDPIVVLIVHSSCIPLCLSLRDRAKLA